MIRSFTLLFSSVLLVAALGQADAARKKRVEVPDRFDGSWNIVARSTSGPCAQSSNYSVSIRRGDASVPGREIDIDGGVSAGGAVQATIIQGSNKVPITGNLYPNGSGSGTWRTSGGLVECSGSWSAKKNG